MRKNSTKFPWKWRWKWYHRKLLLFNCFHVFDCYSKLNEKNERNELSKAGTNARRMFQFLFLPMSNFESNKFNSLYGVRSSEFSKLKVHINGEKNDSENVFFILAENLKHWHWWKLSNKIAAWWRQWDIRRISSFCSINLWFIANIEWQYTSSYQKWGN